jgi:hypothetical protein
VLHVEIELEKDGRTGKMKGGKRKTKRADACRKPYARQEGRKRISIVRPYTSRADVEPPGHVYKKTRLHPVFGPLFFSEFPSAKEVVQ